jgi:hypothetical protein
MRKSDCSSVPNASSGIIATPTVRYNPLLSSLMFRGHTGPPTKLNARNSKKLSKLL